MNQPEWNGAPAASLETYVFISGSIKCAIDLLDEKYIGLEG